MRIYSGVIQSGLRHFTDRMRSYPEVFVSATGEKLFPGTLNVKVDQAVPIREHFRIRGALINEPEQDLLFEICRLNGKWAYRIRPLNLKDGSGGHGDDTLEIACAQQLRTGGLGDGDPVSIEFFG